MKTDNGLLRTPLYDCHVRLNAKMGAFGGWDMPIQYEGILAEYQQTRERVSIFDISHMGEFIIEGTAAETGLDNMVTMAIEGMPVKTCRYGAMLNRDGGIIDDLIVFRLAEEKWFLVVNAATTLKDKEHIQENLSPKAVFQDVTADTGKIDVQGPQSRNILMALVKDIEKLGYYSFDYFSLLGEETLISRTGYSGELGYEIYYPWEKTEEVWNALMKMPLVKPAGLGARDVLRLEVGYSLYGHELKEEVSLLTSGLGKFVDFNKEFIGKEALLKEKQEGSQQKIVGIVSDNRRAPREGHFLFTASGEQVGTVTSGTFSPYLCKGIGLGFIGAEHSGRGHKIFFGDDKKKFPAEVSSRIFYKEGSLKG